jgi:hypothetical protein
MHGNVGRRLTKELQAVEKFQRDPPVTHGPAGRVQYSATCYTLAGFMPVAGMITEGLKHVLFSPTSSCFMQFGSKSRPPTAM